MIPIYQDMQEKTASLFPPGFFNIFSKVTCKSEITAPQLVHTISHDDVFDAISTSVMFLH